MPPDVNPSILEVPQPEAGNLSVSMLPKIIGFDVPPLYEQVDASLDEAIDLARIAAKQGTSALLGVAFNAFAGPVGAVQRERIPLLGFDGGGFTGYGGRLEPAGLVHKGEGVLNQDDMRALGGPSAFHALRASLRRGYDAGGIGGQVPTRAALSGRSDGAGNLVVEIDLSRNKKK